MAIAALILGITAFFINPIYGCSIAAIILGGLGKSKDNGGAATAGLVLGIISLIVQLSADIIVTISTLGMGFFTCCF